MIQQANDYTSQPEIYHQVTSVNFSINALMCAGYRKTRIRNERNLCKCVEKWLYGFALLSKCL